MLKDNTYIHVHIPQTCKHIHSWTPESQIYRESWTPTVFGRVRDDDVDHDDDNYDDGDN